jgi:hypothetical protein
MKTPTFVTLSMLSGMFVAAVAFGNPTMLPQHPGYPMDKAVDPIAGQSLANDPGRSNAIGDSALRQSAAISDNNLSQQLSPTDEDKLREKPATDVRSKEHDPKTDRR